MNNILTPTNSNPRFFFFDKSFLKKNLFLSLLLPIIFGFGTGKASAQCYINMPSLSSSGGCAEASFYPTNYYGAVETMWAKNVSGYIYPQTSWSTSTSTSFCPTEPGYYRLCARRVGCYYVFESYDVYVAPCTTPNLDQYIRVDGGAYQATTSIEVSEGQDVLLDFSSSYYNSWTFTYTGPNGFSTTQTGYADADQLDLSGISPSQSGTYTATYTNPDGCSHTESFTVTVNSLNLPVEWLGFEAKGIADDAFLNWSTAAELNASHYVVERSLDGSLFSPVGSVEAAGTTSEEQHYSFRDENVAQLGITTISYRLKQADIDGTINYSKTVELDLSGNRSFDMSVYPNPAVNSLTIEWTPVEEIQMVKVVNLVGQTVFEEVYPADAQLNKANVNVSNWPKGNYFLQISSETASETRSFVVQ